MSSKSTIISAAVTLGIGGVLIYAECKDIKSQAEELQRQDQKEIDWNFDLRLKEARCNVNFSPVVEYTNPTNTKKVLSDPTQVLKEGGFDRYTTLGERSQLSGECARKEGTRAYDNEHNQYWTSVNRPFVYGLPNSLLGEEVDVWFTVQTSEVVSHVVLELDRGACYDIQYEEGKSDRVVIRDCMTYCIKQAHHSDGERVYSDSQRCDSRSGKLEIEIKPDNLEQTCAKINRDKQTAIDNLPPTISYMWRAL